MPYALTNDALPLETGPDDVIRVSGSRVTLDRVWGAFQECATAEEIVQQYPSLSLADVYHVIGVCLRNRTQVDSYLAERARSADEVRRLNESRWPPDGIRADC